MVLYQMLADLTVVLHAAYVGFVVLGFVLILVGAARSWHWVRSFSFRATHLVTIGIVCVEAITGIECPLTTLEHGLRTRAGQVSYAGDFLGYWVHELIFFDAPPWVFAIIYILFGLLVLATFVLAPPRWPQRQSHAKA